MESDVSGGGGGSTKGQKGQESFPPGGASPRRRPGPAQGRGGGRAPGS